MFYSGFRQEFCKTSQFMELCLAPQVFAPLVTHKCQFFNNIVSICQVILSNLLVKLHEVKVPGRWDYYTCCCLYIYCRLN